MPPTAVSRVNQPSAAMNALVSGFTTSAEPRPTTTASARGATAAQVNPAATPSSAVPASTAATATTTAGMPSTSPLPGRRRPGPGRDRKLTGFGHSAQQGT